MKTFSLGKNFFVPAVSFLALCLASPLFAQSAYKETDLVSDIPGRATFTDPNLKNPWGISYAPTGPFWVSNAGTGTSTLYNTSGTPQALIVTTPDPAGGLLSPTGQVFNAGSAFNADRFIFASEEGVITGWRGTLGTTAETLFDRSSVGANYKGIAIGSISTSSYLYASDFRNNRIDVFGSTGAPVLTGTFLDPTIPTGFAPFNIQNIGSRLFVTYAKQDLLGSDDVAGAGNGFVSIFDLNGNFIQRFASMGPLNSPWGLALAPSGFGSYSGSLLVGNFGDGTINAFDFTTGTYLDALKGNDGNPLKIEGLWGLIPGNGANGGNASTIYFTAGIAGNGEIEDHGLFGAIAVTPVPEPGTTAAGIALAGLCVATWLRRRKKQPAV